MQHFHSLDDVTLRNAWLTIGIFDGVHRGHQQILHLLASGARSARNPSVVLTFTPHPAIVLGGKTDFKCLYTPDERAALLGEFGVDVVVTQPFDRAFANQTAEEFMGILSHRLGLRTLVIGYDTALGRDRKGDATRLEELGRELGYKLHLVPPLANAAGIISSTRIRSAIVTGEVASAASDLGRYYSITGPVIHGDGRGRSLSLPTANIHIPSGKVLPAYGIYACWAWVRDQRVAAATSIGIRPTFYKDAPPAPTIEAHLIDFNQDLYGQDVKLEFVEYLRPEQDYPSISALTEQIYKDIAQTRKLLGEETAM